MPDDLVTGMDSDVDDAEASPRSEATPELTLERMPEPKPEPKLEPKLEHTPVQMLKRADPNLMPMQKLVPTQQVVPMQQLVSTTEADLKPRNVTYTCTSVKQPATSECQNRSQITDIRSQDSVVKGATGAGRVPNYQY